VGAYLLNLLETKNGQLQASQVLGASVNYSPEFASSEPNLNLLRRISEAGGGKMLDILVPGINPFEHDRVKTFQPRDLWEWLLRLAIILFPLDVAIRRVQLDRAEWLKATENLRRWLFFWRGKPRPVEAEESLGALLARRDKVRATTTAPAMEVNPDLFKPANQPTGDAFGTTSPSTTPAAKPAESAPTKTPPAETTSRLLEAKRRAQRK
jgi:hypothetical protein